jgi:rhamnosyltransferase
MNAKKPNCPCYPTIFVDWDNNPWKGKNGVMIIDSTPDEIENGLFKFVKSVQDKSYEEQLVFVNAWNDSAGGNHLEPDQKFGRAFLEATKRTLILSANGSGILPERERSGLGQPQPNESAHGSEQNNTERGAPVENEILAITNDEDEETTRPNYDNPLISIVILTRNGGALFKKSIEMIFSQKIGYPFEVVVVDSSSTDGTLEFLKRYPIRLFEINEKEFSFGTTRDYAFGKAKGKYIVTLSQDVIPANNSWLENLVGPLINGSADVVQGKIIIPRDREIFFWERKGLFYFTSEGKEFIKNYSNIGLSCCSLSMKKEVWFNTRFGDAIMCEDKVIQKKLIENNYKIIIGENSFAYHGHQYNLNSLIKRCENEGLGWRCASVTYRVSQMIRDLLPKMFVYKMFMGGLLSREIKTPAEALFLLIRPIYMFKGNRFNKGYKE